MHSLFIIVYKFSHFGSYLRKLADCENPSLLPFLPPFLPPSLPSSLPLFLPQQHCPQAEMESYRVIAKVPGGSYYCDHCGKMHEQVLVQAEYRGPQHGNAQDSQHGNAKYRDSQNGNMQYRDSQYGNTLYSDLQYGNAPGYNDLSQKDPGGHRGGEEVRSGGELEAGERWAGGHSEVVRRKEGGRMVKEGRDKMSGRGKAAVRIHRRAAPPPPPPPEEGSESEDEGLFHCAWWCVHKGHTHFLFLPQVVTYHASSVQRPTRRAAFRPIRYDL